MVKQILLACVLGLVSLSANSQTSIGAISGALAGAGRSSVDVGESYLLNPASVAHLRGAAILFGTASFRPGGTTKRPSYDGWHLSLNENNPDSMFGSSIYLSQTYANDLNNDFLDASQFNDAWFTMGNFILPQLTVGLSYHFHESQTLFKGYQEHNVGIGFLWTPLENLGVGISFQNLRTPPKEVPANLALGTSGGIGILYFHKEYLRLRLDYSKKFHKLPSLTSTDIAFGLENFMTPWLLARIGISQQVTEEKVQTQKFAFGLGFPGPRFGIHYGFQQFQMGQQGTEHSVDFMIPF